MLRQYVLAMAGSQFGAGDLTQSRSSTFTLDGLNKVLQSLQVDSSPSSELNRALTGWNSRAYPMLNVMGCSADPPPVSVATSSTTVPVVGSVSTQNPQSQVSTVLSGSTSVNIISGNVRSGNVQQAESWKTMMEKVHQTQASLLRELKRSESLISELQLHAALSDVSGSGDIQMNQKSGSGTSARNQQQGQSEDSGSANKMIQSLKTSDKVSSSMETLNQKLSDDGPQLPGRWGKKSSHHQHKRKRSKGIQNLLSVATSSDSSSDGMASGSSHDSDGDSDSGDDDWSVDTDVGVQRRASAPHNAKLIPPFTGKGEKWEVWLAQFDVFATNHRWSKADLLSALLPLLRKSAGEYAFGTLSAKVRSSYKLLIKELTKHF